MSAFNFEAINHPGFFIRHRNFVGELTRKDQGPIKDFAFFLEIRDPVRHDMVSFSSVNFLGKYLRHSEFVVKLDDQPTGGGNDKLFLFLQDSTFFMVRGLSQPDNRDAVSFRSFNFPDRFLRHRDFQLLVEPQDSPNLAPDATFLMSPAEESIDGGTQLNPIDE